MEEVLDLSFDRLLMMSKGTVFQDFTETEVSLLLHRSPEPKDECNSLNILRRSDK